MFLIGDACDPSGNGMFSKTGRKLNKFFMNLNKPCEFKPRLFLNKMKSVDKESTAFRIRKID